MERRTGSEYHIVSHRSPSSSTSSSYPSKKRTKSRYDDKTPEEENLRYREHRETSSNHVHHQQQQQQQQEQRPYASSGRHTTASHNPSHETPRGKSARTYDGNLYDYANESKHVTQSRSSIKSNAEVDCNHTGQQQRSSRSDVHDEYYDDGDVSSVRSSRHGRGEYSDRSSDTVSVRGDSRVRSKRGDEEIYHHSHRDRRYRDSSHRRSHSRQRLEQNQSDNDSKGYRDHSEYSINTHEYRSASEEVDRGDQPIRESYNSRRIRNKDAHSERYETSSSQRGDETENRVHGNSEEQRRVNSHREARSENDRHRMSSRRRREPETVYNAEEITGDKNFDESDTKITQAEICPEPRQRDERNDKSSRSRRSSSSHNLEQQGESRRRGQSHRHSSQEYATLPRKNSHSERSAQGSSRRRSRTSLLDEDHMNDEILHSTPRDPSYVERYQSTPKERRRRDDSRGEMRTSESRHSNFTNDGRRRDNGRNGLYSSESRHSNIAQDNGYEASTVDRRSYRHRGPESESRHDTSSHQRRSNSSYDEPEVAHNNHFRRDNSLSNRSSSSRSNHDTGFHSSASSPRREESVSRFSSDISPSRYNDEESARQSGYEATKSRRRSRISKSSNNNSLDVPQSTLRKDRSLSSSGRGDSSFEETGQDSEDKKANTITVNGHHTTEPDCSPSNLCNGDIGDNDLKYQREKDITQIPGTDIIQNECSSEIVSSERSLISQEESSKAECMSSTSTLRGGNNMTSKISIAGSISSLLSRDHTSRSEASESFSISSVSEKWRKLRQGMATDQSSTSSFASGTASLFSSAASRLVSYLPKVPASFPKAFSSHTVQQPEPTKPSVKKVASDTIPAPSSPVSPVTKDLRTDNNLLSNNNKSPVQDIKSPSYHNNNNNNNTSHLDSVNDVLSPRPSLASTSLSLQSKRANAYVVPPKEPEEDLEEEDPLTPDSEESGQMTPPPMDTDMKRRSKEVDGELTSFLPAEMSRREEKFHDAARVNDAVAIRTILKEKVNVNCRNSLDRTALHWASANGNLAAVEALIQGGADLEAKDKYGMRAVLWSAWFGHIPVLQALVNAGTNTKIANKQGLGILHCAAENNHAAVIAFIFESLEPHDVNHSDKNDRTALHAAAESGHAQAVDVLLQAQADLHKKDKGGRTCVHLAAQHGHVDVLKILLLQGVEVDDRDVDGKTALHLAAEGGHKDIIDLLLDYTANPNSETIKEITPLHVAAMEGHVEVCKSLVKYGCNVNAQNFGNTALHLAANGNHKDVARVLVDAKCETDLPNSRLQTPLHIAVESGHLEVVQTLLAGGASLETREKSGKSALQLAARGNYVSVVDMLIKAERYYAIARDYHDKDVGYVDPDTYLRNASHPNASQMSEILWKLATKQLKSTDWKKLAHYWRFTPEHIKAIEQEYTGTMSYKDHGYRLLQIWLHGVRKDENVLKLLFEALVGIEKRHLADSIRRKANMTVEKDKPCSPSVCEIL